MRLVLVEWLDSYGCSPTWQSLENVNPSRLSCKSVGWLLHEDKDCTVIVPHISGEVGETPRQGCGDMTIPSIAIISIHDLQDVDACRAPAA